MSRRRITVRRYDLIDRVIKGRLRFLKDEDSMLSLSSPVLFYLMPALLMLTGILADGIPRYASAGALAVALVLILLWASGNPMTRGAARAVLYLTIPAVVYSAQEQPIAVSGHDLSLVYVGALVACLISSVVMVRFNRRRNSFRSTPMDFLILVVAMCASPLLTSVMGARKAGLFLVQILVFFYGYEILLSDQRKGRTVVLATTVGVLLIIALKGVVP